MAIKDALGGLYQLARDLTGTDRKEDPAASIGRTRTYTGTALGPSSDGSVLIQLDSADVVSQDGTDHVTVPTCPSVLEGDRVMVTSVNGTGTVSYVPGEGDRQNAAIAAANQAASEAQAVAEAVGQHFFADTNGIHVTTEEEEPEGTHNILINSLGILLRALTNNLVSITSSAIAFFDGLGNAASNIIASFGASGATIGYAAGQHLSIDSNSVDIMQGNTVQSTFSGSAVELGKDSISTEIKMCADTGWITAQQIGPQQFLSFSALDSVSLVTRTSYPSQSLYSPTLSLAAPYVENGTVMNKSTIAENADVFNWNGVDVTKAQMAAAINGWVVSTGSNGDWRWKVYRDGTFDAWCRQGSTTSYQMTQSYYGWYFSNQVNNWYITGLSYSQIISIQFVPEFPTVVMVGTKQVNNSANPPTFGCWLMSPNSKTESGRVIVIVHGVI